MANTITVSVLGDVKNIRSGVSQVNSQLGSLNKAASGVGRALKAVFAGALVLKGAQAIKNTFSEAVKASSDLQQSTGSVESVFKKQASGIEKVASGAAKSFGLSKNSYQELATVLGAGFKNQGIKDFAGATKETISLGADLAAQYGGSTKQAVEAIGSLMRGEADPIEKYGVSIKESAISAELAAKGQNKLKGASLEQAKAQARLSLLFKQTKDAQGAFTREGNTYAVLQQKNAAATENLKAKLGTALLPVLTQLQGFISSSVLPVVSQMVDFFAVKAPPAIDKIKAAFSTFIAQFRAGMGEGFGGQLREAFNILSNLFNLINNNRTTFGALAVAIGTIVAAVKIWAVATKVMAAAQVLMNIALTANPIGIVVVAIAALVAALIYAYKNSETFRRVVTTAWIRVKAEVLRTVAQLKAGWNRMVADVKRTAAQVKAGFSRMGADVKNTWNRLVASVKNAALRVRNDAVRSFNDIRSKVSNAVRTVRTLVVTGFNIVRSTITNAVNNARSRVSSGFSNIRSSVSNAVNAARNATTNAFNRVRSAIVNAINTAMAKVRSIRSTVVGALAGAGAWLVSAGANLIRGFISGITGSIGGVVDAAVSAARSAVSAAKSALGIASPSKEFAEIGKFVGLGLIKGIEKVSSKVESSVTSLATGVTKAFSPNLTISSNGSVRGLNASLSAVGGTGGTNVYITIEATPGTDKMALAKEIQSVLDYGYRNGLRSVG